MEITKTRQKRRAGWLILIIIPVLIIADLMAGSVVMPFNELISALFLKNASEPVWVDIVWNFRLTKVATCLLAGAGLSLGGLQMQTLFRNPLAGPDVLGLSSGASLAVSLLILGSQVLGNWLGGPWTISIAASIGCASVFLIMLVFSYRVTDSSSLLIIGLMVGAGTSSLVGILQFTSRAEELQTYLIWTFGNIGSLNWGEIGVLTILVLIGVTLISFSPRSLNAWLLGDNYARALGINVDRTRILTILSTSILTGAVTAFCGPIAFVGIAVPHLAKLWFRTADHKVLIPYTLVLGASFMLVCDLIAQIPGGGKALPLNAITALFGAPLIIWLIINGKKVQV